MLIGLHGRKQAGKDTVYQRLSYLLRNEARVERASFADLLYESAAALFSVSRDVLDRAKSDPWSRVTMVAGGNAHEMNVRTFLQRYGTEAHREVFGDDFWVEQVDLEHEGRIVVVTDVRFANEARAVRKAGGHVVLVVGPDEVQFASDDHASESLLPSSLIDATLHNVYRTDGFCALDAQACSLMEHLHHVEETR